MRKLIILLFVLVSFQISAQQQLSGNLLYFIDSIIDDIPRGNGADDYQKPTTDQFNTFKNVISGIINQDYSGAHITAQTIGYRIIQYLDNTGVTYYILLKNSSNYWGTFVFNPSAIRGKLVIQSPHAIYDSYTGKQGALVFKETGSFAFFMNGTHRCNSSSYSVCDGTTSACSNGGPSTKYRASDQAHNIDGTFQAVTQALEAEIDSLIYIQLHGFTKGTTDPYLIMSNGTSAQPVGIDYLSNLKDALYNVDDSLTFKIPHIDIGWTRLMASTNTQGRFLNGSGNPCSQSAAYNSGRFIHIEQERSKLRDSDSDRMKMATAIIAAFPPSSVTAVEDYEEAVVQNGIKMYPNPFNSMTNIIFTIGRTSSVQLILFDVLGRKIETLYNGVAHAGSHNVNLRGDKLGSGIYFISLVSNEGLITKKIIHMK